MNTKNLSEKSNAYYDDNYYYELFSSAEDYSNKILDILKKEVKGKNVLDAGCKNGRFLPVVSKLAKHYYGIDVSSKQLTLANNKIIDPNKVTLICADLCQSTLEDNSMDFIYLSWVLGTILSLKKRKAVLDELIRVLKPGGKILLIENNVGNDFEILRGRDKDNRTEKYNNWVVKNGFKAVNEFTTTFQFNSIEETKKVFEVIYGEEIASKIQSRIIKQNIIIFEYIK